MSSDETFHPPIPIVLLKSPSPTPASDAYTTHLSPVFTPHFVPVLSHNLLPDPLIKLFLTHLSPSSRTPFPYGALIFTSQRAVACFNTALTSPPIQRLPEETKKALRISLYTVGPATEKALREIRDREIPQCKIFGGERAGNGEMLARSMLGEGDIEDKYTIQDDGGGKPRMKPVLFLVGETRRDIIPRMLMSPDLGVEDRIQVDEMVVYQTNESDEFQFAFESTIKQIDASITRWIVLFSPTAGKGVLKGLGWLDETTGRRIETLTKRSTFVACIGPTTRDYLEKEFGVIADVTASRPSPQGVKDCIESFMKADQR